MNLYNEGTLDAIITGVKASVNINGEQPGDPAFEEFVDKMNIKVTYTTGGNQVIYNDDLRGLLVGNSLWVPINPAIAAAAGSGAMNIAFEAHLDSSASNALQGKDFVFDFSFFAEQIRNNSGSIDLSGSDVRVETSWMSSSDLDSHLTGPDASNGRFHINYANPSYFENGLRHAHLLNDSWSAGTETTTIDDVKSNGVYRFSVYRFSGVDLPSSSAQVKVYKDNVLVDTYDVPQQSGSTWTVFEIWCL
jgi:hypothetical protein